MSLTKYVNTRLLRQIEGKKIEFVYLSDHPDLSVEVIKAHPDAAWDWESILAHDNMCLDWLIQLPDAPWNWEYVPDADRFEFSWILALPDAPWRWELLHNADQFSLEWVNMFPDKPWNMFRVSCMPTIADLKEYQRIDWDWAVVTHSSPIEPCEMINNDFPWDFSELAFEEVTNDDILFLRHFKDRFDPPAWTDFTFHTSWKLIRENLDLPWNFYCVEPVDFEEADMSIIRDHVNDVNWNRVSIMIPYHIILKNPDLPWSVEWLSMNDSLRWEDLPTRDDWDYSVVPCEPVENLVRRWTAANVIKRRFKMAIANPEFLMCRNRLEREGRELEILGQ